MAYDMLAPSYLLEQDIHRRKHYPYIYWCPNCQRSRMEKELQEKCRFCDGPMELLQGGKSYIYFCQHCDKRIVGEEPKMACPDCGNKINTIFRWDMLGSKEKRRVQFARIMQAVVDSFGKIRTAAKELEPKKQAIKTIKIPNAKQENKRIKGEELPSY